MISVARLLPLVLLLGLTACSSTLTSSPPPEARLSTPTASPSATAPDAATAPPAASPALPSAEPAGGCHAGDPLAGVYHPARLSVERPCATITGTVACIRIEPDGDRHVRLRIDDRYRSLLTSGNSRQRCTREGDTGPHLVVEILPQHCGGVRQRDAEDNCADRGGFTSPPPPQVGSHVAISGPLVVDESPGHGETGSGWVEIHPAEVIELAP